MSASFTNNGDGTVTLTFEFTAQTDKIQKAADKAVERLYERYPVEDNGSIVPVENLTVQQKLGILDQFVKDSLIGMARVRLVEEAIETAEETANQDDSIDLG